MRKFIRRAFGVLLFILSGGLIAAKRIVDWVGRTTFPEDSSELGPKVAKMLEWLSDQPALVFYVVPLFLAAAGLALLFLPDRSAGKGAEALPTKDAAPALSASAPVPDSSAVDRKAAIVADPTFVGALRERKTEIVERLNGLLAEAKILTTLRQTEALEPHEFDERIRALSARRSGQKFYLGQDDTLADAAFIVPRGQERLQRVLTTARAGNYSAGGEFLSTSHASLVATVKYNLETLGSIIDEAISIAKMAGAKDETALPASLQPIVDFNFRYPDNDKGQFIHLVIAPKRGLTGVIVIGQFARAIHSMSHAEWRWSSPMRLTERPSIIPSEIIEIPLVERQNASKPDLDHVRVAGSEIPAPEDSVLGQMILAKVIVSTDVGTAEFRRLFNFRFSDGRQFIDTLDLEAYSSIEDRGALS